MRPLGAIDIQGMTWSFTSLVRLTWLGNDSPWSVERARYISRLPVTRSPVSRSTVPSPSTPIEACIDVRHDSPGRLNGAGTRSRTFTLRVNFFSPGLIWLTTTDGSFHSFTNCQIPRWRRSCRRVRRRRDVERVDQRGLACAVRSQQGEGT